MLTENSISNSLEIFRGKIRAELQSRRSDSRCSRINEILISRYQKKLKQIRKEARRE